MSVAGPNSLFKNIEGLVVYVTPDTTDERINEFSNFILLDVRVKKFNINYINGCFNVRNI